MNDDTPTPAPAAEEGREEPVALDELRQEGAALGAQIAAHLRDLKELGEAVSRQTFRFRNYRITPDLSPSARPTTHTAQCADCEERGPEAGSSDVACAWIAIHLRTHPEHLEYWEHISRPYQAEPAEWLWSRQPSGFWCELVARSPDLADEWYLAGAWADTPDAALAWLRERAERLAGSLAPPVADVFTAWLADAARQTVQRDALAAGLPVSANAAAPDRIAHTHDVHVLYSLTCRPLFIPHPHPPTERNKQPCTTS